MLGSCRPFIISCQQTKESKHIKTASTQICAHASGAWHLYLVSSKLEVVPRAEGVGERSDVQVIAVESMEHWPTKGLLLLHKLDLTVVVPIDWKAVLSWYELWPSTLVDPLHAVASIIGCCMTSV
jgi:hypothetical protein